MIGGLPAALCLVLGGALLLSRPLLQARADRQRLALRVAAVHAQVELRPVEAPAPAPRAARPDLVGRLVAVGLDQTWGIRSSGRKLAIVAAVAAAVIALPLGAFLHAPAAVVAGVAVAASFGAPRMLVSFEQRRAEAAFLENLPNVVDMIIRMLRAGLPVTAAIRTVAEEAPLAVRQVFVDLADQIEIGLGLADALTLAADRVRLPDFRFFAASVALQSSTGGNLTSTLEILAEIIRRRRAMRLKAKALTAEVRMSSYVLCALPVLAVGALMVMSPHYLTPLLEDPRGRLILVAALSSLGVGLFAMRQLMRRAMLD